MLKLPPITLQKYWAIKRSLRSLIERYFCLPLVQAAIWGGALTAQHGAVVCLLPGSCLRFLLARIRILLYFGKTVSKKIIFFWKPCFAWI
ncbi:MAG: hypothetical protein A2268_05770 [Candidatus Raymondbacteria bacterium RifOxyA12_full_50_37]|uniref:Uncharacterized protein n=1 Tax=Candidatus Raymondbacteria bacterium RIFOXYD12_FULL_49_13 TaxID=1817890 RepID=A0A1F7FFH3_UNCRA|nr:MAG: hypothetical protein A2268_05770 [Candidatus Raymondbacteria bacterium RifOxyA12_full_50_37]OGJ94249.1 MAG: hypothetical protein A2248_14700 [Candidatus Raymondbacteria bacterium RIFOXYA2_FULL_49_16]OGJ94391.1 MAG: hypothetical protein A2350_17395 [Candidatus Raymondbacteria bacterium RifOxyB12_full_50_8]OGJ94768.1 MAG: hypothetical protein A2487_01885 [Candidatus Raymondbacteria bacterium RifOxyC12_full_50_8]OGJ99079.1 MAG: hypothetical protein A2453_11110 [Candidatus Raymondbacteria b